MIDKGLISQQDVTKQSCRVTGHKPVLNRSHASQHPPILLLIVFCFNGHLTNDIDCSNKNFLRSSNAEIFRFMSPKMEINKA